MNIATAFDYDYFVILYLQAVKEVSDPIKLADDAHTFANRMLSLRKLSKKGEDLFDLESMVFQNDFET